MPRCDPSRRVKNWEISTSPEIVEKLYSSRKPLMNEGINVAFTQIDQAYNRASEILDRYGVHGSPRGMYRSFVEECWRAKNTYSGEALTKKITAIAHKYIGYGCNEDIIKEIAAMFGVKLTGKTTRIITFGLG